MSAGLLRLQTADGPFSAILAATTEAVDWAGSDVAVVASGWTADGAALIRLVAPALIEQYGLDRAGEELIEVPVGVTQAERAVNLFYDGVPSAIVRVRVKALASPFRTAVWDAMRHIPAGEAWSYGRLAGAAGRPGAARAVGGACSGNPAALFVPCHRVVPAGGGVGQFGWGPKTKAALLAREGWPPDDA
jgi:O-6-methylguanine DNA methyltransferase